MELREGLAIGSYRLMSPAGTGGMAEVWRAYHPRLRRYVAIKFLSSRFSDDSTYLDRFLHEAQAISRLDHPHILTIYDFGEQDGWTYMVSPFVGGGTLASRMRRGPWAVDEAVSVLEPLASALDYAHSEGIVHRDVKPSNVLFTERDRLVLSDFGIARMIERSTLLTQAGLVIGTPMYMSPEQADGQPVTGASDRYSLGVVAYEMLTGRPPFMAETPLALLRAHIDKPLPPPRTLNPALSESVEVALFTLLAKDPADRFGSGLDFVAALHATTYRSRLMAPPADLHTPTQIMETDDASSVRLGEAPGPSSLVDPTAILPDAATASSPADTPGPGSIAPTAALPTVPAPPIPAGPTRRGSGTPAQRPTDPDETRLLPARRFSRRQVVVGLGALTVAGVGAGVLVLAPRALEPVQPTRAPTAPVPSAPAPATSEAPAVAALPSPTAAPLTSAPPSPSPVVADASPVLRRTMPIENDTGLYLSTMALSPDGQVLATGSTNGLISLWRVDDGSEIRTFNGVAGNTPTSTIFKVRFSPDGSILAAGTSQGVQVWDIASGRSIRGLNSQALGTSSYASAVAFSPDGEL